MTSNETTAPSPFRGKSHSSRRAVVLITGASRGLGLALAEVWGERGASVLMVARGAEALEREAARLRGEGFDAHAIVADIGQREAAAKILAKAAEVAGPISVLLHNASTLGPTPLRVLSEERDGDVEAVFETNCFGPMRLTRATLGQMALRNEGLVIHISSDAATEAYATWGAYGASKAAFDQMSRVWQSEWANTPLRFITVNPGEMDTKMHADAMPDADRSALRQPSEVAEALVSQLDTARGHIEVSV